MVENLFAVRGRGSLVRTCEIEGEQRGSFGKVWLWLVEQMAVPVMMWFEFGFYATLFAFTLFPVLDDDMMLIDDDVEATITGDDIDRGNGRGKRRQGDEYGDIDIDRDK